MAAAIGADLPVADATGSMVVDIGGGTTEVGVISLGGMVYSGSRARRRRQVRRGDHQLHPPQLRHADRRDHRRDDQEDDRLGVSRAREVREMEVKGRNLAEGIPRSFTISSNEILEALTEPLNQHRLGGEERARADAARARRRHRREGHGAHRRRRAAARPRPPADGRDRPAGDRRRRSAHLRGARLGQGAREDGATSARSSPTIEYSGGWTTPPRHSSTAGRRRSSGCSSSPSLSLALLVVDARFRYVEGCAAGSRSPPTRAARGDRADRAR